MSGEFKDYKRGPGFWFLFEMLIAADVSKRPYLSARLMDIIPNSDQDDLYEVIDTGLTIYERLNSSKYKDW